LTISFRALPGSSTFAFHHRGAASRVRACASYHNGARISARGLGLLRLIRWPDRRAPSASASNVGLCHRLAGVVVDLPVRRARSARTRVVCLAARRHPEMRRPGRARRPRAPRIRLRETALPWRECLSCASSNEASDERAPAPYHYFRKPRVCFGIQPRCGRRDADRVGLVAGRRSMAGGCVVLGARIACLKAQPAVASFSGDLGCRAMARAAAVDDMCDEQAPNDTVLAATLPPADQAS